MTKSQHILYILLLLLGAASPALAQTIKGNVYGGGELAKVEGNTHVTIEGGSLGADIFGGGEGKLDGTVLGSADVSGATHVTINGGEFAVEPLDVHDPINDKPFKHHYNIYGGGNIASKVGETHVYVTKGMVSNASAGGSDFLDNDNPSGMAQAYYHEGQMYFCIFGGGYGKNTSVTGNTWVDFSIGSGGGITDIEDTAIEDDLLEYQSYLDVVGGGFNGSVGGNTNVHVGGNAMCRNVYGGGLYATIGTKDVATTGNTNVHITGGNVDNVYGGGVMGDIMTSTNVEIGLKESLTFEGRDYAKENGKVTILMSVYGANDVSGHVPTANIVHNGGTIDQNIYGAGNGDYRGYYTPNVCAYNDGENDNYYIVTHAGDVANSGRTYKGRPQTDNVNITMGGNSVSDKAVVLGQVFGGGNSCTVGLWDNKVNPDNPHEARDNYNFFLGGGSLNITLNSHVSIGRSNSVLSSASETIKAMYTRDGENVSGLFMGCSGDVLATQSTDPTDYDYHHYYDAQVKQYLPGFAVFDNNGNPLNRQTSLYTFYAYLNNILVKSDDVKLEIDENAEDIWLANFVGGGFRGSMKRKTENKPFVWDLPKGVTIGNCVVGGAYNTDVVYRVYDTEDDMHTYKTDSNGQYIYRTTLKPEWAQDTDYHHIEYAADGTTPTGIVRFYYDGGILSKEALEGENSKEVKVQLNLACKFEGGAKARVFGGCFTSGIIDGDTEVNYAGTGAYDVYGGGALANILGNTAVNLTGGSLTNAYGGGLGRLADSVNGYTAVAATVDGNATTTLNGSQVLGSIFGANNVNGTPKGHVKVHVLQTKRREGQPEPYSVEGKSDTFDVLAVYGGGNKAAYEPTGAETAVTPNVEHYTTPAQYAEVLIENCDNSIAYVYGGGNAAPVPATEVIIHGANAIDNAFAGGNGFNDSAGSGANPGADVGYLGYYSTGHHTEYGAGTSYIAIEGGTVHNVFGGSNTLGYIRTHANVEVPEVDEGDCPLHIGNIYSGGNRAEMYCGGSMILSCSEGVETIYAGANSANIHGDIVLDIKSGTYGNVFGGNNQSGNIYGGITVNIDETGCWPIMIGNLYGCGSQAAYSVYGYTNEGPRTKAQFEALSADEKLAAGFKDDQPFHDPTVNVISCTRIDHIFGGGKGPTATVHGNPTVNVNTIKGRWAGCSYENDDPKKQMSVPYFRLDNGGNRVPNTAKRGDEDDPDYLTSIPDEAGTIGTIYGGGNAASVFGNTRVNIGTLATAQHISGTDMETEKPVSVVILGNVFGGSKGVSDNPAAGRVTGTTKVIIGE